MNIEPEIILEQLEKIARNYNEQSNEYIAISIAAKALLFIHATRKSESFSEYLNSFNAELSPNQAEFLKQIGLE